MHRPVYAPLHPTHNAPRSIKQVPSQSRNSADLALVR